MLHMHEVTGSSPVVPTIKRERSVSPLSFYCEAQGNLRPRENADVVLDCLGRGAHRRYCRGDPFGVSATPCCPHHKTREERVSSLVLLRGAGEPPLVQEHKSDFLPGRLCGAGIAARNSDEGDDFHFGEDALWKHLHRNTAPCGLFGKVLPVHFIEGGKIIHVYQKTGRLDCVGE